MYFKKHKNRILVMAISLWSISVFFSLSLFIQLERNEICSRTPCCGHLLVTLSVLWGPRKKLYYIDAIPEDESKKLLSLSLSLPPPLPSLRLLTVLFGISLVENVTQLARILREGVVYFHPSLRPPPFLTVPTMPTRYSHKKTLVFNTGVFFVWSLHLI